MDRMSQAKKGAETSLASSAKRDAILDAAGAVFLQRGYEAATTLEIAKRARTSKRALYEHFGSKRKILSALIRTSSQRMTAPLELPMPQTRAAFFNTLRAFGAAFLKEFVHPHRISLYRLAISQAPHSAEVGRQLDASGRGPVVEAATRLFRDAAANGYVDRERIATLIETFFAVLIGQLQIRLLLGIDPPPTQESIEHRAALAVTVIERLARGD